MFLQVGRYGYYSPPAVWLQLLEHCAAHSPEHQPAIIRNLAQQLAEPPTVNSSMAWASYKTSWQSRRPSAGSSSRSTQRCRSSWLSSSGTLRAYSSSWQSSSRSMECCRSSWPAKGHSYRLYRRRWRNGCCRVDVGGCGSNGPDTTPCFGGTWCCLAGVGALPCGSHLKALFWTLHQVSMTESVSLRLFEVLSTSGPVACHVRWLSVQVVWGA